MLSAVVNVGFLAAYPLWSLMMIALDVTVILALTVHGSEMRRPVASDRSPPRRARTRRTDG